MDLWALMMRRLAIFSRTLLYEFYFALDLVERDIAGSKSRLVRNAIFVYLSNCMQLVSKETADVAIYLIAPHSIVICFYSMVKVKLPLFCI